MNANDNKKIAPDDHKSLSETHKKLINDKIKTPQRNLRTQGFKKTNKSVYT